MSGPQITRLSGNRLHLHHGPIDLILWAEGPGAEAGYTYAARRFDGLLAELVAELPALRSPDPHPFTGPVAQAMAAAVAPYRPAFITPMAAVAGAVADAVMAALTAKGDITRAYANNGGDIALHLAPGQSLTIAVAGQSERITVRHTDPVRGIATSGWRGRSFSLGIADAVTALAPTAAMADAAATMIANAVDLPGHPAITRRPACDLQADSDLGPRPVTMAVGPLSRADAALALTRGLTAATTYRVRGLITSAALYLHPEARHLAPLSLEATHA